MNIKSLLVTFFSLLLVFFSAVPLVAAQSNIVSNETVTLRTNQTINGNYFAAGEKVTLSGTINGDAYVAGGNVIVDGTVNGDLLVAGGNIALSGTVTGDVRSAGGNLTISGTVGRNITAVGGAIDFSDSLQLTGSVVAAGGNVTIRAPIPGSVTVGAGNLTVSNTIGSGIQAGVGGLTLTPRAKVTGNMLYISDNKADIQSGAVITGKTTHRFPPKAVAEKKVQQVSKSFIAGAAIGFALFSYLSSLVVGLLFIALIPRVMQQIATHINDKFLPSLGSGLLFLVVVPLIAIILCISLIGIPLGVLLFVVYMIVLYFSHIITSLFLGQKLFAMMKQKGNTYVMFAVGLLTLTILGWIPVIGFIVGTLSLFAGIGALVLTKYSLYNSFKNKKLL